MIKQKFHDFIDNIDDLDKLESYLSLLQSLNVNKVEKHINLLNDQQKQELKLSIRESLLDENLVDNEIVKSKYSKWL